MKYKLYVGLITVSIEQTIPDSQAVEMLKFVDRRITHIVKELQLDLQQNYPNAKPSVKTTN